MQSYIRHIRGSKANAKYCWGTPARCYMTWFECGCVPQSGVFGHLSVTGSTVLGDWVTFKRQVLGGRSKVLRTCLLGYTPGLLPTLFSLDLPVYQNLTCWVICRAANLPFHEAASMKPGATQTIPHLACFHLVLCHHVEKSYKYIGHQTEVVIP